MPSPKESSNSPTNPPVIEGFFSPPLANWKELKDLPEPTGPLPEEEEEDGAASSGKRDEMSKESASAESNAIASGTARNPKESGKDGKDVKREKER